MLIESDINKARQKARDDFAFLLIRSHPDPDNRVRQQIDHMLDKWWPGTEPSPSEEAGEAVAPDSQGPTDV